MDYSEISNRNPDVAVQIFCLLAEDEEVEENFAVYESASHFISHIWNSNPTLVTEFIEKIACSAGDRPRIAQALMESMLKISDPKFDSLCFEISKKRTVPEMTSMVINSCLLFRQHEGAINRIDDTIRKACQSFLKNKLESFTFLEIVRQSCIFRRKELHSDISSVITSLNNDTKPPYIHISEKKPIEVISNGMVYGETYLKEVLKNPKSQYYEKAAAIFALGCENNPAHYTYFEDSFNEFFPKIQTEICNEIVGAVIYSCYDTDVIRFLVNHLEQLRNDRSVSGGFLNLRGKHKTCIIERLLLGCTHCLCSNIQMENELKHWLEHKNKGIQVSTVLALETMGIKCINHEKELKAQLKSERDFRKDCIFFTDLINLRQCNLSITRAVDGKS
jgi:glutamate racemase